MGISSCLFLISSGFCDDSKLDRTEEDGFTVFYPIEAFQETSKGKRIPDGPTGPAFFIDGNQGNGLVELVFRDAGRIDDREISECFLAMDVTRYKNSGSNSTFRVSLANEVIGQKKGAKIGKALRIPLDSDKIKDFSMLKLSVGTGGSDGLRVDASGPGRPRLLVKFGKKESGTLETTAEIVPNFDLSALKPIPVEKKMTYTHGLLVVSLGNSRYAAQASKLSLSALPIGGDAPASMSFNQPVGSMMSKAVQEVLRFHVLRHNGWPKGSDIQFAFAEKYSGKDGPSAAVACSLLIESMLTGAELRTDMAVTGDMNADGTVQPVGGVRAKIRGASKGGMKLVVIPVGNRDDVLDLLIVDGPTLLTKIQIFSVTTFDDALAVATKEREANIARAIEMFDQVSSGKIKGPAAKAALQLIIEKAPNHISAKLLLSYMRGTIPKQLSLRGSLDEIDDSIGAMIEATSSDISATSNLDSGQVSKVISSLQRLRGKVDDRVRPYCDAWIGWARKVNRVFDGGAIVQRDVAELKAAANTINAQRDAIRSNESIQDDLIR